MKFNEIATHAKTNKRFSNNSVFTRIAGKLALHSNSDIFKYKMIKLLL